MVGGHEEMQEALGPFAKYVPVQSKVDETCQFNLYMEHLQSIVLECEEWQEYFNWKDIEQGTEDFGGNFPILFRVW